MSRFASDFVDALTAAFSQRAGAWLALLVLAVLALALAGAVFVLHVLLLLASRGRREIHGLFRAAELHALALMMLLLSVWCGLTAVFSFLDRPYAGWLAAGTAGLVASVVHLAGVVLWLAVGLLALRLAGALLVRAYRRPGMLA